MSDQSTYLLGDSGFHIGDVVKLKAGGPDLTVFDLVDGDIIVHWFPHEKKINAARFAPSQIELKNKAASEDIEESALSPSVLRKLGRVVPFFEKTWAPGDVVVLNSGGPQLSVRTAHERFVETDWIDSKNEHHTARFHPQELQRVGEISFEDWSREELEQVSKAFAGKARTI